MLTFILLLLSINVFVLMLLLIMYALISALMYSASGVSRQMGCALEMNIIIIIIIGLTLLTWGVVSSLDPLGPLVAACGT